MHVFDLNVFDPGVFDTEPVTTRLFVVGGPPPRKRRVPDEEEHPKEVAVLVAAESPDPTPYPDIAVPGDPELNVPDLVWAKPSERVSYDGRLDMMKESVAEADQAYHAVIDTQRMAGRRDVVKIMEILNLVDYLEKQ